MLIVALTGGIATGKSVAAGIFRNLGCVVQEADKVAHELMEPGTPAWKAIVKHFGEKVLNPDRTLNRKALGKIVYEDRTQREFLNRLLHPLVMEKKKETIRELQKKGGTKIFVSVAALTVEAGFAGFFDKIVVVTCRREDQIQRLMARDKITRQEALLKLESQLPPEEKLKLADYTIDTSGTLQETIEQSERVFRSLLMDYEMKMSQNP
ncbi:MAG: dephospho-CoA kinase [Candidatus Aminicenantales bacterium]